MDMAAGILKTVDLSREVAGKKIVDGISVEASMAGGDSGDHGAVGVGEEFVSSAAQSVG